MNCKTGYTCLPGLRFCMGAGCNYCFKAKLCAVLHCVFDNKVGWYCNHHYQVFRKEQTHAAVSAKY